MKKILPITALPNSVHSFDSLLSPLVGQGNECNPRQTGGETTPSCGSVRNYSTVKGTAEITAPAALP